MSDELLLDVIPLLTHLHRLVVRSDGVRSFLGGDDDSPQGHCEDSLDPENMIILDHD